MASPGQVFSHTGPNCTELVLLKTRASQTLKASVTLGDDLKVVRPPPWCPPILVWAILVPLEL